MLAQHFLTQPQRLERLKRWRDAGWLRLTFNSLAIALVAAVVLAWIIGFYVGFSYTTCLLMMLVTCSVSGLIVSQLLWIALPVLIELLEEPDPRRNSLWQEANVLALYGALFAFVSNFLSWFHLIDRSAAEAELMLLITGLVVWGWGLIKIRQYWRTSLQWLARSRWERMLRTDLSIAVFVLALLGSLVRACYTYAAWAEHGHHFSY